MAIQINGFTITSLEKIHGYDRVSGVCEFLLDELKSAKIANTEDTTDITGKGDRVLKLDTWKIPQVKWRIYPLWLRLLNVEVKDTLSFSLKNL